MLSALSKLLPCDSPFVSHNAVHVLIFLPFHSLFAFWTVLLVAPLRLNVSSVLRFVSDSVSCPLLVQLRRISYSHTCQCCFCKTGPR